MKSGQKQREGKKSVIVPFTITTTITTTSANRRQE